MPYDLLYKPNSVKLVAIVLLAATMLYVISPLHSYADHSIDRIPSDVYRDAVSLKEKIILLQKQSNIDVSWPKIPQQQGKEPYHVFQKTLEILEKINRYRIVKGLGQISVSHYPGRTVTPNEVYDMVERLEDEIEIMLPKKVYGHDESELFEKKTSNDVYQLLSEISKSMDVMLGIRGFNPSDAYVRAKQITEEVKFLRRSQNLPMNVKKAPKPSGKHQNHALKSTYDLLKKIKNSEEALKIDAISIFEVPRREITPSDVYDAQGIVLAELQRIKYSLGLERNFKTPEKQNGKTPNDVIQQLEWATLMLPDFANNLVQYDQASLTKTSNHVFAITEHVLKKVQHYRKLRGIQIIPELPKKVTGKRPEDVYQKSLKCMELSNKLRQQVYWGRMTIPKMPHRIITLDEVYEIVLRLDEELTLIFNIYNNNKEELFYTEGSDEVYSNKTPSDVYYNIERISLFLGTIIGPNKKGK